MASDPVTPHDVYQRVGELMVAVQWLCNLIYALFVFSVAKLFAEFLLSRRVRKMLSRVEELLTLTETHGAMTDEKAAQIKDTTTRVGRALITEVKHAAKELKTSVPPRVVEEMTRQSDGSSSGMNLGTVKPNPNPEPPP